MDENILTASLSEFSEKREAAKDTKPYKVLGVIEIFSHSISLRKFLTDSNKNLTEMVHKLSHLRPHRPANDPQIER